MGDATGPGSVLVPEPEPEPSSMSATARTPPAEDDEGWAALAPEARRMFRAARAGDVDDVHAAAAELGDEKGALDVRDGHARSVLHWAALSGNVELVKALLDAREDDGDGAVSVRDEFGQEPLMWGAMSDSTAMVDVLLARGADAAATDTLGLTALHHAACGNASDVCVHFVATERLFGVDAEDPEGHTALTWAAYKGSLRACEALASMGADLDHQDHDGCTPTIRAAMNGHVWVVHMFLRYGADLNLADNTGTRARQAALEAGQDRVVDMLKTWKEEESCDPTREKSVLPVLYYYVLLAMLNFGVIAVALPEVAHARVWFALIVVSAVVGVYGHVFSWRVDPGYIPRVRVDPLDIVRGRYCPTCKINKPLRSKHCSVCNRCVHMFDHHCPWINNCVGRDNHKHFLRFVTATFVNDVLGFTVCLLRLTRSTDSADFLDSVLADGPHVRLVCILCACILGALIPALVGLVITQWNDVIRNITTNERLNVHRYEHFRGDDGEFANPFDRGLCWNLYVFCCKTRDVAAAAPAHEQQGLVNATTIADVV